MARTIETNIFMILKYSLLPAHVRLHGVAGPPYREYFRNIHLRFLSSRAAMLNGGTLCTRAVALNIGRRFSIIAASI